MGTLPAFGVLDIDRTWGNGSPLLQVRAPYGRFDLPKALIASIAAILLGMARRTSVGCTKAICSTKQIGGVPVMRIEEKSASEDDTDLSNRDAASAGGERDCRGMYDLYSRASVKCDSQLPSPREKARPSRQGLLDRRCNRRADDFVCPASAPDRDRLLGSVVRTLRRIFRVWNRLLSFSGQLHDIGLWRHCYVTCMEIIGTSGSGKWNADVWCLDRDDFCRDSTID